MEQAFWVERWEKDQIGFHQQEINRYLSQHWNELGIADGAPVFVPLCGKSLDMLWLRDQGHAILGIELSEKALLDFFQENALPHSRHADSRFVTFQADNLRLLCGDFFHLQAEDLQGIAAVYDRAALIALPPAMRQQYVQHMARLLPQGAHLLLITLEYAPGLLQGPPFSVDAQEVEALYQADFEVSLKGRFEGQWAKGKPATESVYCLTRR